MAKKKGFSKGKKVIFAFLFLAIIGVAGLGIDLYHKLYSPNVIVRPGEENFLYIPTGTTFPQLVNLLVARKVIDESESFRWAAEKLKLPENVHPGRYALKDGMSNYELIKLIRSGTQTPVKLVINKFRAKEDFTSFIGNRLEIDSTLLLNTLNDEVYLRDYGFTPAEVMTMFIPNTYEFYWTTPMKPFLDRMREEYTHFWTQQRMDKARALDLTPSQVSILASIVEEETNRNDEKQDIASVYLNRLKKGILLQADPTVKFALQDFAIKRVRGIHTQYDSPYNTYKYKGLPPGPICTPSIKSIDAVLNANTTDYYFFCASVDRLGYHAFARNLAEHQKNAAKYQRYLSLQGIR